MATLQHRAAAGSTVAALTQRPQIEFEMEFFEALAARLPDYAEVLQAQAGNLTSQGRMTDGLKVDQRIVTLKPADPTAHYNLACRYALMQHRDQAIAALQKAIDLGYRDFRFMSRDEDLKNLRKDPRFRQLLKDHLAPSKR
jgi:tetratricopeptide (TPR) repeat protein